MGKRWIIAIVIVVIVLVAFIGLKIFSIIGDFKFQMNKHTQMSTEELLALDDEELFKAISDRVDDEIYFSDDIKSALENANKEKQVFYTVYWFESEVQNGGLCQYFCNSSNLTAPYLSEALEIIGAKEQKALFDKFVKDNDIDVNDLSMFETDDVDEYIEKTELLDFDSFDNSYYKLDENNSNVYDLLKVYARENVEKF